MLLAVLQKTQLAVEIAVYFFVSVLQSITSPLEIVACSFLVNASETECQSSHFLLAIFVLWLALCDWHVPRTVPLHYTVCRFLSAMCMYALYPTSATMICLAFADPTFG